MINEDRGGEFSGEDGGATGEAGDLVNGSDLIGPAPGTPEASQPLEVGMGTKQVDTPELGHPHLRSRPSRLLGAFPGRRRVSAGQAGRTLRATITRRWGVPTRTGFTGYRVFPLATPPGQGACQDQENGWSVGCLDHTSG